MTLSLSYTEQTYNAKPCNCRAHRQHRIFACIWENPSIRPRDMARLLKMKPENVRNGLWKLRKRDLAATCPLCMEVKLLGGVCQNCGFEPDLPVLPLEILPKSQWPTNSLHAGSMLGSEVNYNAVGFVNRGWVLKRLMDKSLEDPLVRAVKSDVENELKRCYPQEVITDEAGKLVVKEILEFRSRYPALARSKNARKQLTENVLNRLKLLHPRLRVVIALSENGHE